MYPSVVLSATLMASFALRHPYLQAAYVALVAALDEQDLLRVQWGAEVELFAYTSLLAELSGDAWTPGLGAATRPGAVSRCDNATPTNV